MVIEQPVQLLKTDQSNYVAAFKLVIEQPVQLLKTDQSNYVAAFKLVIEQPVQLLKKQINQIMLLRSNCSLNNLCNC